MPVSPVEEYVLRGRRVFDLGSQLEPSYKVLIHFSCPETGFTNSRAPFLLDSRGVPSYRAGCCQP